MVKSKKMKRVGPGLKKYPVEYKLTLAVDLEQAECLGGMHTSFEMTVPIRKGAGDRLAQYKKEDVVVALRQLADYVETQDPSSLSPLFGAAMAGGMSGVKAGKKVAKTN
jgi:hypothetical protein